MKLEDILDFFKKVRALSEQEVQSYAEKFMESVYLFRDHMALHLEGQLIAKKIQEIQNKCSHTFPITERNKKICLFCGKELTPLQEEIK